MIFETSSHSAILTAKCNDLVGSQISFFEKIASGSISSPTLKLIQFSSAFGKLNAQQAMDGLMEIEIRPKGIIVHFQKQFIPFSWAIPFYKLHTYQSQNVSIHADGHFMKFTASYLDKSAIPFFKKLHQLKVNAMPPESGYFDY